MTILDSKDIERPVGDPVQPIEKAVRRIQLDLDDYFDDGIAKDILGLTVDSIVSSSNLLLKSMYEFDLDTEDGVERLLSLLPILDPEIIKTITQEIWPGYPVDSLTFDNSLARAKIKGYLLDFLDGHGTKPEDIDSTDEEEPDGGAESPSPEPEQGGALEA